MNEALPQNRIIDFDEVSHPYLHWSMRPLLRELLAVDALNHAYAEIRQRMADGKGNFFESAMEVFDVRCRVSKADWQKIPEEGPVVVVANHPFGGLDGIILGSILTRVRPDSRLLVNYLLGRAEGLRDWIFGVDPFDRPGAAKRNLAGMKKTLGWLKQGGLVGTFPAGMVSHIHLREGGVVDRHWSENTAGLVRRTQATVVPVYFEGRNSLLFQLAGLCSPILRTALLPRELMKSAHGTVSVKIGNPIPWRKLAAHETDEAMTACMRLSTYFLKNRDKGPGGKSLPLFSGLGQKPRQPIIAPIPREAVAGEIGKLPEAQRLVEHGDFEVYYASYWQIPQTMREIARLREITFRAVKEGTGRECAMERCDRYYLQLFLWDRKEQAIAGGYRMGQTDRILRHLGAKGLYSSKLFAYKENLFATMNPALELGRSFIRPEYQRKHAALALVWRGIGEYAVRNPRYKLLFGPVSTSQEYLVISKALIMEFLRSHVFDNALARFVRARNPPEEAPFHRSERETIHKGLRDIDDVSNLISGIEGDGKGVPVLLRHYLKLNGTILSFNIDNDFGSVMDSLIVVDLTRSDPRILKRYMGEEGLNNFLAYHRSRGNPQPGDAQSVKA